MAHIVLWVDNHLSSYTQENQTRTKIYTPGDRQQLKTKRILETLF